MVVFKNRVLKLLSQTKYFIVSLFNVRMLSVFKLRRVLIWTEKAAWLCCPYGYHVYFHLEYLHILWIFFSISSDQWTLHKERHPTWVCNSCSLFPNKCFWGGNCRKLRVDTWPSLTVVNGSKCSITWPPDTLVSYTQSAPVLIRELLEKWKGHCLFRSHPLD